MPNPYPKTSACMYLLFHCRSWKLQAMSNNSTNWAGIWLIFDSALFQPLCMLCSQWSRLHVIGFLITQQTFNILASSDRLVFIPNSLPHILIKTGGVLNLSELSITDRSPFPPPFFWSGPFFKKHFLIPPKFL